jgi:hypothetical protein
MSTDQEQLLTDYNDAVEKIKQQETVITYLGHKLDYSEGILRTGADLLRKSTEDIHMLLAFINSKGLEPPQIQSKFIN